MSSPKKHYRVTYEARREGAIGLWYPRTVAARATDDAGCLTAAREVLRAQGYETRNPISAEEAPPGLPARPVRLR